MTKETIRPLFIIGDAQKLFYTDSMKIDNLQQCTYNIMNVSRNRVGYVKLESEEKEEYYIPIACIQDYCDNFDILCIFNMAKNNHTRGYKKLKGMSYKKNGNIVLIISLIKQVGIA